MKKKSLALFVCLSAGPLLAFAASERGREMAGPAHASPLTPTVSIDDEVDLSIPWSMERTEGRIAEWLVWATVALGLLILVTIVSAVRPAGDGLSSHQRENLFVPVSVFDRGRAYPAYVRSLTSRRITVLSERRWERGALVTVDVKVPTAPKPYFVPAVAIRSRRAPHDEGWYLTTLRPRVERQPGAATLADLLTHVAADGRATT